MKTRQAGFRRATACATGAACALSVSISAADPPVVHGVPSAPLVTSRVLAGAPLQLTLDAAPPASTQFYFEIPLPTDGAASGTLSVWPRVGGKCDARADNRQYYRLGMVAVKDGDTQYLRATVPPLQVGQQFCFSARLRLVLSSAELGSIAGFAADLLVHAITAPGVSCDLTVNNFSWAFDQALSLRGLPPAHTTPAAALAYLDYKAKHQAQCDAVVSTRGAYDQATNNINSAAAKLQFALNTSSLAPLPPLDSPRVTLAGASLTTAAAIATAAATSAVLKPAALQLRARASKVTSYSAADIAVLTHWADALDGLASAIDAGQKTAQTKHAFAVALAAIAAAKRQKLSSAEMVTKAGGDDYVPSTQLIGVHGGVGDDINNAVDPSAVVSDLKWIAGQERPTIGAALAPWSAAFTKVAALQAAMPAAVQAQKGAEADATAAQAALAASLPDVFMSDAVRAQLVLAAQPTEVAGIAGYGATPSAVNYASVDAGALLAFPSGGTSFDPWTIPYLGLNLYATAVDRVVPFDQLVGGGCMRVRQRLSLTIGMTLAQPSLVGRTINPPFGSHFPILALGWRTSQYTRVVGGAVLYHLAAANPASSSEQLVAAPFIGASLDIDVVHLLTQATL